MRVTTFGGQKGYSQEFVFPRFWRSSGELFSVNADPNPLFYVQKAQIVQKLLGKSSDDSLLLKDFFGPRTLKRMVINRAKTSPLGAFHTQLQWDLGREVLPTSTLRCMPKGSHDNTPF